MVAPLRFVRCLVAVLLLAAAAWGGTPGTFRGILGEVADRKPGWMYVRGQHDMVRVVYVRRAEVRYDDSIPREQRNQLPRRALTAGAEVRVTAEQDARGDWRATEIEILKLSPKQRR